MTLIVTVATHKFVAQASDRRLTNPVTGELFTDHANKAVVLECQDGILSFAYAGAGFVGERQADGLGEQRTDDWLLDVLSRNAAAELRADETVTMLAEEASQKFASFSRQVDDTRLSIVVAGWPKVAGLVPGIWWISNFESSSSPSRKDSSFHISNTKVSPVAEPTFEVGCMWLRREVKKGCIILVGGQEQIVIHPQKQLRKLRDFLLRTKEPEEVTRKLVNFIRRCADDPKHGKYIGRNCMAVFLSNDHRGSFYYDEDSSRPVVFAPNFVGSGGAVRDIMYGTGKGPSLDEIQQMIDRKRQRDESQST